jgi:hypothetical protein
MTEIVSKYSVKDGQFIREDTQDTTELLRMNAYERNEGLNNKRGTNARKVASIPIVMLEALKTRSMEDGGPIDFNLVGSDPDHSARFARWLNSPDNYMFRTSIGRVGLGTKHL